MKVLINRQVNIIVINNQTNFYRLKTYRWVKRHQNKKKAEKPTLGTK